MDQPVEYGDPRFEFVYPSETKEEIQRVFFPLLQDLHSAITRSIPACKKANKEPSIHAQSVEFLNSLNAPSAKKYLIEEGRVTPSFNPSSIDLAKLPRLGNREWKNFYDRVRSSIQRINALTSSRCAIDSEEYVSKKRSDPRDSPRSVMEENPGLPKAPLIKPTASKFVPSDLGKIRRETNIMAAEDARSQELEDRYAREAFERENPELFDDDALREQRYAEGEAMLQSLLAERRTLDKPKRPFGEEEEEMVQRLVPYYEKLARDPSVFYDVLDDDMRSSVLREALKNTIQSLANYGRLLQRLRKEGNDVVDIIWGGRKKRTRRQRKGRKRVTRRR